MPQIKGSAGWLTNVRQETAKMVPKKSGIDESRVKLENGHMDERLAMYTERLHMQKHRRRADQEHEIRVARSDASKWQRMRELIRINHVSEAMNQRRKEAKFNYATGQSTVSTKQPNFVIITAGGGSHGPTSARGRSETAASSDRTMKPDSPRLLAARAKHGTRPKSTPGRGGGTFNRNSKSNEENSPRDWEANFKKRAVSARSKSRPKTSIGFYTGDLASSSSHSSQPPGRSFAELRDLCHIDKLSANEKAMARESLMEKRRQIAMEQDTILQTRISTFYAELEEFIKRTRQSSKEKKKYAFEAW